MRAVTPQSTTPVKKTSMDRTLPWALLLAFMALALRLYHLGAESLWIDEGYSIRNAMNFNFAIRSQDVRPLYFVFLSFWLHLGHSEFILRLPAALFGAGAVPVIYLLGRYLAGVRTGIFAAALLAISPLHIDHSQEIRMYSLATLLSLAAMYQFVLYLGTRKSKHLIWYLISTVMSVATFPLTALLLVVQNIAAIWHLRRNDLWRWAGVQLLMIAPGIFMFLHALRDSEGLAPEKLTHISALNIVELVGSFSLFTNSTAGSIGWYAFFGYTFVTLGLIAGGILMVGRKSRNTYFFLLLWLAIPMILTAKLAEITGAQWLPRYVIYSSPAYFLLLGITVDALSGKPLKYLAVMGLMALPIVKLAHYYEMPSHPQWHEAVRFIEQNEQPGDAIEIYRPGNGPVFRYYYHGKSPWKEVGWPMLQKKRPWTEKRAASVIGDIPARHRRVWLVMSQYEPEAGLAIENYIRRRYAVVEQRSYKGIEAFIFKKPTIRSLGPSAK